MPRDHSVYRDRRWRTVRLQCLTRDQWRCRINGPKCLLKATEADHIIEPSRGGARYDLANLQAACKPCNAGKGAEYGNRQRGAESVAPWP